MSAAGALEAVYVATGLVLWAFAWMTARDATNPRRYPSAAFWFLFGVVFAFGSVLPHRVTGLVVIAMVLIDGAGLVRRGESEPAPAGGVGARIFLPVAAIPVITLAFGTGFGAAGLEANRGLLIGLGVASVVAMLVALASLGMVLTAAGVGDLIARGVQSLVPTGSLFFLAVANAAAMALLTLVLGNTFAAFPVIAAGITVPLLVKPYGADPALVGIVTLTAGSCGTLVTLMAANFNVVPVALLGIRSQTGVVRYQAPVAAVLWVAHVLLLWGALSWH